MPTNIDFIEVKDDKSLLIQKSIDFPGDELYQKDYKIEKSTHIEIALNVLSGNISAKDGIEVLCHEEGLTNYIHSGEISKLTLGGLLQSLVPQSMPGHKKIQYIDEDLHLNVKRELGLDNEMKHSGI